MGNHEEITIRYTLGPELAAATGIEITLYNLAGEEVEKLDGTVFPNAENVVRVPSRSFSSGIYLCSVRARSGSQVETHLGKFAVIR
jgi:hypothetical protein